MKTRSDEHIKGEVLELYAINEQAAKDSQTIEDHLLICEGCRVRLVEVERFKCRRDAAHGDVVRAVLLVEALGHLDQARPGPVGLGDPGVMRWRD